MIFFIWWDIVIVSSLILWEWSFLFLNYLWQYNNIIVLWNLPSLLSPTSGPLKKISFKFIYLFIGHMLSFLCEIGHFTWYIIVTLYIDLLAKVLILLLITQSIIYLVTGLNSFCVIYFSYSNVASDISAQIFFFFYFHLLDWFPKHHPQVSVSHLLAKNCS